MNPSNQIITASNPHVARAVPIIDVPLAKKITLRSGCACVIGLDNRIYCWGTDAGLGSGSCNVNGFEGQSEPIGGLPNAAPVAVDAGDGFACALLADGSVYCWGDPTNAVSNSQQAQRADLPPVRQLDAGDRHICAVTTDGRVFCWGQNRFNQIGDGKGKPYNELVQLELY